MASQSDLLRIEALTFVRGAVAWRLHKGDGMKPTTPMNDEFESTYALLVRSEEKSRSQLEIIVYLALVLSAVFSIWQFAHQSVILPTDKMAKMHVPLFDAQRG